MTLPAFWLDLATSRGAASKAKEFDQRVRIRLADDHPVIGKTSRSMLEGNPRFEGCGEAAGGAKAIEKAPRLKPDVVVLNISMLVLNGFEAARETRTSLPEPAIVILSSNADQHFVQEAKKIGVRAYAPKTETRNAWVKAIEAAPIGGDFVLIE